MTLRAALGALAASAFLGACATLSPTEAGRMQRDLDTLREELRRLSRTVADNDQQLFYRLQDIQDRLSEQSARSSPYGATSAAPGVSGGAMEPALGMPAPPAPSSTEADVLYQQAMQAWADDRTDEAQQLFEQLASQFPTDPRAAEAHFMVGEALYKKQEYAAAIPIYRQVVQSYPGFDREAEAAAKIGYCHYWMGQNAEARSALENVLLRYPSYEQIERVREILNSMR